MYSDGTGGTGIAGELERLERLRTNGTLTDVDFARAKEVVLSSVGAAAVTPAYAPGVAHAHLEALRHQQALERLDREWQMEREQYLVRGRYGSVHTPDRVSAVLTGIFGGGFSIFWTVMAANTGAPAILPLFGLVFIVLCFGSAIGMYGNAVAYEDAEAAYRRRREVLLERQQEGG